MHPPNTPRTETRPVLQTPEAGSPWDTIVIGAGLAGLTAAALLARAGQSVLVLERSKDCGGRARSQLQKGQWLNFGAHALYRKAEGARVLRALGISPAGKVPAARGNDIMVQGQIDRLPAHPLDLWQTRLLTGSQKLRWLRLLFALATARTRPLLSLSLQEWIQQQTDDSLLQNLALAFCRLSSYANAPEQTSAGATLQQFQAALKGNVWYLHRGWQSLVHELQQVATQAGATIQSGAPVKRILHEQQRVCGVECNDGATFSSRHVIAAIPPQAACQLVEGPAAEPLQRRFSDLQPVQAACLDLVVSDLPRPERRFVLGVDQPLYFSNHSHTADLGDGEGEVLHLLHYLHPDDDASSRDHEAGLKAFLDQIQPGWRERVRFQRFLPRMTVSHALVQTHAPGEAVRPSPRVSSLDGLFVAGDWVGQRGMLADVAFASAEEAAQLILTEASPLLLAQAA